MTFRSPSYSFRYDISPSYSWNITRKLDWRGCYAALWLYGLIHIRQICIFFIIVILCLNVTRDFTNILENLINLIWLTKASQLKLHFGLSLFHLHNVQCAC